MSEDLTDYLTEQGIRVQYLHSEVDTLRRVELLRELRMGIFDVLVGINLLREGLDLPEVSLVAILDSDKAGFLRSATALIQTIGRAARNVSGQVHMYADSITPAMEIAISETNRRRAKQLAYNLERGLDPQPLRKKIADITDSLEREISETQAVIAQSLALRSRMGSKASKSSQDLIDLIAELTVSMQTASENLQFEIAARFRDEISDLRRELRGMQEGQG
jgi:excinuclease ABC subunit B